MKNINTSVELASDSWNYGYTIGTAYSNYLHSSKQHSATVINTNTGRQGHDEKRAAFWAEATVGRGILDKAAIYYNYW